MLWSHYPKYSQKLIGCHNPHSFIYISGPSNCKLKMHLNVFPSADKQWGSLNWLLSKLLPWRSITRWWLLNARSVPWAPNTKIVSKTISGSKHSPCHCRCVAQVTAYNWDEARDWLITRFRYKFTAKGISPSTACLNLLIKYLFKTLIYKISRL